MSVSIRPAALALQACLLALLGAAALPAQADGLQLYTNTGTLGLGLGAGTRFTDSIGARIGFNTFRYDRDGTYGGNAYTGKLKFGSAELLVDWWLAGPFRVTAGLVQNNNKVTLDAKLANGTVNLNGTSYPVNAASAEVDLGRGRTAPYLGLGFASRPAPGGGFGFRLDFGAVRQSPVSSITIDSPAVSLLPPAQRDIYEANKAAEEQKLRDDVGKLKYWPVINLGVTYSF